MTNKGNILVADDVDDVRDLVVESLNLLFPGYEIEQFSNGNLIKRRLEQELETPGGVKLLVTDNDMKIGPTGSELIANYAKRVNFPIILNYGGIEEIGKEAIRNGAYGYLLKPFIITSFGEIVGGALGKSK